MNIRKLIRDLLILVVFCGAFYGLTRGIDLMGDQPAVQAEVTEYSAARIAADDAVSRGRWEDAIVELDKLIVDDPFNGHAWYTLGEQHAALVYHYRRNYRTAVNRGRSQDRLDMYLELIEEHTGPAIAAFERAMDFARFRNLSRVNLAHLYNVEDRDDEAIAMLRAAMEEGFSVNGGLRRNFFSLRSHPEFEELREIESEINRRRIANAPTIGPGM
ncbi:MAG: hypothetical protein AAF456_09635 [Planctomycetota bacterium]